MIELPNRKEDYQLTATLTNEGGGKLTNLQAKIFLPQPESSDEPVIYLLPTERQASSIRNCFPLFRVFSFKAVRKGKVKDVIVSADEVFSIAISTRPWGKGRSETIWKAVPVGIKVLLPDSHAGSKTEVRFWITPTSNLSPVMITVDDWRGHRRVERHHVRKFRLSNGLPLQFDRHFIFEKDKDENVVIKSHMVAVTDFKKDELASTKINTKLLQGIDDFLLIAGLAIRTRSYCYGWKAFDKLGITICYRGNVSRSKISNVEKRNADDELIGRQDHSEFIKTAYLAFMKEPSIELLRDALYSAVPSENLPLESQYTNTFSGIETLVLAFRRLHGLEFVFDEKEAENWIKLRDNELRAWLRGQSVLANDADKRARIYENLAGLDRVSFSHAFKSFCEYYKLDLKDLWPIAGGGDKHWSLTTVRNKLVHGDVLGNHKFDALSVANVHLRWTLERMLLVYLGWDVNRSNVDSSFLNIYNNAHKKMKDYRSAISS